LGIASFRGKGIMANEGQSTDQPAAAEKKHELSPLPDWPYRPFLPYDREDQALFVGREHEILQVADLVTAPGVRIVLVHGRSGVGKSSLLRAGVLPHLEEKVGGYLTLRDRSEALEAPSEETDYPVLSVRTTHDLPGQLAAALACFYARHWTRVTAGGATVTVDLPGLLRKAMSEAGQSAETAVQANPVSSAPCHMEGPTLPSPSPSSQADYPNGLRAALLAHPSLLSRLLDTLAENLLFEPVVLIEQGEELFTLAREPEDAENRSAALDMLAQFTRTPGRGKLLVSLRTEYYGRLIAQLGVGATDTEAIREFFLTVPSSEQMLAAALRPTLNSAVPYSTETPLARYGFEFAEGLAEKIVGEVREAAQEEQESPLSLLQVVCAQLAEAARGRGDRVIRAADLKDLGEIRGASAALAMKLAQTLQKGLSETSFSRDPRYRLIFGAIGLRFIPQFWELLTGGGFKNKKEVMTLLGRLCRLQPDGSVTRDLVPEERLQEGEGDVAKVAALIARGAEESVGLFEVAWLGPPGQEKRYVSLSCDALAPVIARWDREEKIRRVHGRKVTVDWLWVVIPLGVLAAVLGWFWYQGRKNLRNARDMYDEDLRAIITDARRYVQAVEANRPLLYFSQMAQAEQAWEAEDLVRMRQLLLNYRQSPQDENDLRGFEWYHLWLLADRSRSSLAGHNGWTTAVALSPDGTQLASAGADGLVRVWDPASGNQKAELSGHVGAVLTVAFAGDGARLASGGEDGTVFLWSLGKKKALKTAKPLDLKGHGGPVRSVLFIDSKTIASASQDGTVRLWDVDSKVSPRALKTTGPVLALALSPRGQLLASASEDGSILLWDAGEGKKRGQLPRHPGPIHALAFAPDGKTLASASTQRAEIGDTGVVKLWDVATQKETKAPISQASAVRCLAFSGDGKTLATGGADNAIHFWNASNLKEKDTFRGHLDIVSSLAISADGKTLASGSYDGTVKLWSPDVPGARQVLGGLKGGATCLAISPDNKLVASADDDGAIHLWPADTGRPVRTLQAKHGPAGAVAFALLDKTLILASAHNGPARDQSNVVVWDASKGTILHTLNSHPGGVNCVALTRDGTLLACGGADKVVRVWDVRKGKVHRDLPGHGGSILSVAFSASGRFLASGDARGQIRIWQPDPTKQEPGQGEALLVEPKGNAVTALAFSPEPEERELASASEDRTVRRWDRISGKVIYRFRGGAGRVLTIAYTPRGESLVTGGANQAVRLWTLEGTLRFTFPGHAGPVTGVAFASDQRMLASASRDGTVRLWRAAPEESMHEEPHGGDE
jgi:WD40 repeat protein